jgi:drug/metabolite transporter (DMT)-like permease
MPAGTGRDGSQPRAGAALALAVLFWSGNFIAGRALRHDIEPALLNLLRWSLGQLVLLPWAGAKAWRCRRVLRREWRLLVGLGATGIAAFHTLSYLALQRIGAIDALLTLAVAPAAILAGAALSGRARPTARQWAGAALSLFGVAVLLTRGDPARLAHASDGLGQACMLAAVAAWAAYSLLLERRPADLPADAALIASIVAALPLLVLLTALSAPATAFVPTPRVGWALGYIVVLASAVAYPLWTLGVAAIGPMRAGPYLNLMPVFGIALAVALLGETVVLVQVAGAACVLGGIVAVGRPGRALARQP